MSLSLTYPSPLRLVHGVRQPFWICGKLYLHPDVLQH